MPKFWKRKRQVRTSPPSHHLSQICDKVAAQRSQRGGSRLRTGVPHLPTSHWNLNPYERPLETDAWLEPVQEMCLSWKQTNLLVQGWVSIDRSEVAALLSTTPRPKTRSSTNDLAPPRRMGSISCRSPRPLLGAADNDRVLRLNHRRRPMGPSPCIRASRQRWHWEYRHKSGRDSDLEAFSHNPSDGSLAPLAYQPSTSTKCLNLRFLSYWAELP